jgi:hypothetical protein
VSIRRSVSASRRLPILALIALALVATLFVSPALAASPTISDGGSARCCVRVNGTHFTPNSWAYVEVVDNGQKVIDGWFQTSATEYGLCGPRIIGLCTLGGTISVTLYPPDQCVSNRVVWAQDWSSGVWSNPVNPGCA